MRPNTSRTAGRRAAAWMALPLTLALTLSAGCSIGDGEGSENAEDSKSAKAMEEREKLSEKASDAVPPVFKLTVNPGTGKGFVEAPQDVRGLKCEQDANFWNVSGTVANPTKKIVDYRIYTYLQTEKSARGLLQTDVDRVAAGKQKKWSGKIRIDADDLQCILRVERTPVA